LKDREISVRVGHRDYTSKEKPYSNAKVPFLLLKGNWLSKAGFIFYKKVKVTVNENCLVITTKDD
jgi:toxic protein SymE